MKRIVLFLVTNIANLLVLSISLWLLGFWRLLMSNPPLEERIATLKASRG